MRLEFARFVIHYIGTCGLGCRAGFQRAAVSDVFAVLAILRASHRDCVQPGGSGVPAPCLRLQRGPGFVLKVCEMSHQQVRKRRDDAEAEREEMDRLKAEESRLREQQQYGDWQKKEEHFHLKQATQRSKVNAACRTFLVLGG